MKSQTNFQPSTFRCTAIHCFGKIKKRFLILTILALNSFLGISQPIADFTSDIKNGCAPIIVHFKDLSQGKPTEWHWDLGNGTYSNLQNPSNTYFNAGTYTIKLIIKASNKKDSIIKTSYIIVNGSPIVNFKSDVSNGCSPLVVKFTDETITANGTLTSRKWDFGDGYLSDTQNPTHEYTAPGNYNVTLTATNLFGCISTVSKLGYIKNNFIKGEFSSKVSSICTPTKINFQNESNGNGNIISKWDFGDNTTSASTNPTHIYEKGGTYIVKLIVDNQLGCTDTITKTIVVLNSVNPEFTSNQQLYVVKSK